MIPNFDLKKQEFHDERNIYINGRIIPGVSVRGTLSNEEWMLYEPIVLEGMRDGKKYYYISRVRPYPWDDVNEEAFGVVIFRSRGYTPIFPLWADGDTKFAEIPLKVLRAASNSDLEKLFQNEDDWEEEFKDSLGDVDPEEDAEYIAAQRADFFNSYFNLNAVDPDAFVFLDLYEHSGQVWSAHGCGTQCRWDTTSAAAVLLLDEYRTKQYKEDPKRFWDIFRWFMKRMGGEERSAIYDTICIDAETYERVEEYEQDYCYTLNALFIEVDDNENLNEIEAALEDITGATDLKVVENVEFKPRDIVIL